MDTARTVGTYRGEKVPAAQSSERIVHFPAIASEEDGAAAWAVTDAEDIAFFEFWTKGSCSERIVVGLVAPGIICYGITIVAR